GRGCPSPKLSDPGFNLLIRTLKSRQALQGPGGSYYVVHPPDLRTAPASCLALAPSPHGPHSCTHRCTLAQVHTHPHRHTPSPTLSALTQGLFLPGTALPSL
ncbi:hypothetical protein H1C71_021167, partial [Ictidomys tridecemlineatus]